MRASASEVKASEWTVESRTSPSSRWISSSCVSVAFSTSRSATKFASRCVPIAVPMSDCIEYGKTAGFGKLTVGALRQADGVKSYSSEH
jgi:hypothetical protein